MNFRNIQFDFYTSDNFRLYSKIWLSENFDSDRVIVFHHGLGEHCDRYGSIIEILKEENFSFFSYDIRGHGRSSGNRGDSQSILRYVLDLEEYIYTIKREYKISKPFLLGHSLGGLVTSYFCVRHTNQQEIKSLLLSAPALKIPLEWVQYIKKIIGHTIFLFRPTLILKSGLNPKKISHNQEVVKKYIQDPLVHSFISVRLGLDMFNAIEFVKNHCKKIKIPVWIGHGSMDTITSVEGSKEFYNTISSEDKELKIYHGLYHEIFNESSDIPLKDFKDFVLRHL
ncbi:MAG: lysophospholipase [Leptonema sp. (in: bacteria)]